MSHTSAKIYVGAVGVSILLDTEIDISEGTSFKIEVKKPDNSTATWTGTREGLSKVKYVTGGSDLNIQGVYKMQAHVTAPSWESLGETVELEVAGVFA